MTDTIEIPRCALVWLLRQCVHDAFPNERDVYGVAEAAGIHHTDLDPSIVNQVVWAPLEPSLESDDD